MSYSISGKIVSLTRGDSFSTPIELVNEDGTLTVRRRYNGTYSLTVNSDYNVDVYKLVPPSGMDLFE